MSTTFGQRQRGHSTRGRAVNRSPLRKVVGYVNVSIGTHDTLGEMYSQREELECGHIIRIKQDLFGQTNASRRRCHKCAAGSPEDV